ncbi:MAG TPA: response regulator transcription factor [Azospirillaceae bacterium]|nr:response regulator transcription factor [Azospirillaceae bacterium]
MVGNQEGAWHLLVVEDEEIVLKLLAAYLEKENFRITRASTGREMMAVLDHKVVHAILLDLNLPDEDGLALARIVRARSTVPIVVLTARTSRDDRLAALRIGVDDYLQKPVDPEELSLRLQNLLTRMSASRGLEPTGRLRGMIEFSGWRFDTSGRTLLSPDDRDVPLTPAEFNLLSALALAPGRVLSRSFLLDAVARTESSPSERLIDVLVSRLRQKIEPDRTNPRIILTVPGHGYKLVLK